MKNCKLLKNFFITIFIFVTVMLNAAQNGESKPNWIDRLPDDGDYIYAIGRGEDAKLDNARQTAFQEARSQLSKVIEKKVGNLCRDYIQHADKADELNKFCTDLSSKVSKSVISNSQLKDSYTDNGKIKVYYALLRVKTSLVSLSIEQVISSMSRQPDYRAIEKDLEKLAISINKRFNAEFANKKQAQVAKSEKPLSFEGMEREIEVKMGKEPTWIKRLPNDRAYYIGIGQGTNLDSAKANAVNMVASQIKVGIKSQVNDYMSEVNGVTDEDVSVNITLSVKENIEDVEFYDAWQSPKQEFWVYARLNIATYQRKQLEKLENAKMNALDYLIKCDQEVMPVIAFKDAFMGYYFISPYITKSIKVDYNGKDVVLLNELMSRMNKIANGISIIQTDDNLSISKLNPKPLKVDFTIYGNDERVGSLPVTFSVENGEATFTDSGVTDFDGEISCVISKVKSNDESFTLVAHPDFQTLVKGMIDDPVAQKYFVNKVSQLSVPNKRVVIEIERPTFGFKLTTRGDFNKSEYEAKMDNLATSFKNKFSDKMRADFVDGNAPYNMEMIVSGSITNSDGQSNFIFAKPTIAVKIFDNATKAEIFSVASQEIKQGGNTEQKAVQKAIEKFISSELNGFVNEIVKKWY